MSDKTIFTWIDGTSNEASLTSINDSFETKFVRRKTDLKEVVIGDKVKSIESNAFKMCKNLEKVQMPQSVEKIGVFAFAWCEKLEEINLPDGIDTVSISAFTFCTSLKSIKIPDSVTLIDDEAFSYCTELTDVTLPSSLKCIYVNAFLNCKSIKALTIPATTESIDGLAFSNCESLETVTFEDGSQLREIGSSAFACCYRLDFKNTEALVNLTSISDRAFEDCTNLTSFVLPESLASIGERTFGNCRSLTGPIKIPQALKNIDGEIFDGCISLESVAFIPKHKYEIKDGMFTGCEKLSSVTGLNNAVSIGNRAFMGCTLLTEITLGAGLKSIGAWAFKGCLNLSIALPQNTAEIGHDAFAYVKKVTYDGSADTSLWGYTEETDNLNTQQYYITDDTRITKERKLQFAAYDLVWYLRYMHNLKMIPDDIFKSYDSSITKYILGDENEYILANMLSQFDDAYDTPEFPLDGNVEKLRDRLYIFQKELV